VDQHAGSFARDRVSNPAIRAAPAATTNDDIEALIHVAGVKCNHDCTWPHQPDHQEM
jgi:hypothetical protein